MAETLKGREYLEDFITRTVVLQDFPRKVDLDLKISALIFLLEKIQRIRRSKQEPMRFEEFEQCKLFVDIDKLVLVAPKTFVGLGSGTRPIQLQAPLLLFLLLHHRDQYQILEIIESFVGWVWKELSPLDFKKTKTGVTRCFTNTRFAANTLRDYGLLKFTQSEAFKTWELSLTGFLVAASILESRRVLQIPTELPLLKKDGNFDLSAEVRDASKQISTYRAYVDRLAMICARDTEAFKSFEPTLKRAFELLREYWVVLSDPSKTPRERRAVSLDKIKRLEREGVDDKFYSEFSRCVQINDALARIFEDR